MFGEEKLRGFEYKGYSYDYELDIEPEENCKVLHVAIWGKNSFQIDWSPYSAMTKEDFILWVDAGRPERFGTGSLNRQTLEYIKQNNIPTWLVSYNYEDGTHNFRRFTARSYEEAYEKASVYRGRISCIVIE